MVVVAAVITLQLPEVRAGAQADMDAIMQEMAQPVVVEADTMVVAVVVYL
jgi:hypothetical protein